MTQLKRHNFQLQHEDFIWNLMQTIQLWKTFWRQKYLNISNYRISLLLLLLRCFSHVRLCDPIQGSLPGSRSLGFSRQEHWSGLPFPSPMYACMLSRSHVKSKKCNKLVNITKNKQTHKYREQVSGYQWRHGRWEGWYRGSEVRGTSYKVSNKLQRYIVKQGEYLIMNLKIVIHYIVHL